MAEQYVVIERFRGGDPGPVYARFRERGRLMPEGLRYVASWVRRDLRCCYQIVEADDPALLAVWTAAWEDLVAFEIHPVISSAQASALVADRR